MTKLQLVLLATGHSPLAAFIMWIKICGTTNLDDAQAAVEAGADALGFIFAPSARRISPRDAARIVAELPPQIEKIGVFLNQTPEIVLETVEKAGLDGVQLHGNETLEYARDLLARTKGRKLRLLKGVYMTTPDATMAYAAGLSDGGPQVFSRVLFDSGTPSKGGGTGKTFDWAEAAPVVRFMSRKFEVIIAGGLTPTNVTKAIETFHPFGVDVVSGIEREPGRKDHDKMRAFIAAARSAVLETRS